MNGNKEIARATLVAMRNDLHNQIATIDDVISILDRANSLPSPAMAALAAAPGQFMIATETPTNDQEAVELDDLYHDLPIVTSRENDEEEPADIMPSSEPVKLPIRTPEMIIAAIRRLGRFVFTEQLQRELIRDGTHFGDELGKQLKRMAKEGIVTRLRYNSANVCVCYGLPAWLPESLKIDDQYLPIGKQVDYATMEIL